MVVMIVYVKTTVLMVKVNVYAHISSDDLPTVLTIFRLAINETEIFWHFSATISKKPY